MAPSTAVPNPSGRSNIFLLAADASPALLPQLRSDPSLASSQDSSGYSLLHALASYNHLDLLRQVVAEFHPPRDLKDSDGETALFVVETVAAAQCLVEELELDWRTRNNEGETAEEKIRSEGDFVVVADYLAKVRRQADPDGHQGPSNGGHEPEPMLPEGMSLTAGTMAEDEVGEVQDQGFRARIEELAHRDDFEGEGGQAELRALVQDAVRDVAGDPKEARPRLE